MANQEPTSIEIAIDYVISTLELIKNTRCSNAQEREIRAARMADAAWALNQINKVMQED